MTLEESIKHCEDVADYDCFTDEQRKCSEEHRQQADWLRELKERREKAQLSGEDATFDCISRQEAIEAMCSACGYDCDEREFVYNAPQDEQIIMCPEHYALSTLPSAEPEIIHCKDCKYYYNTTPENIPTANIICFQMHEDDYCSYAERRTDERYQVLHTER